MVVAAISSTLTHQIAAHGILAVFTLMAVDAVFPAASELVMLYAGAVAAGAFSARVSAFGANVPTGVDAYLVLAAAGTVGYLAGALIGWWVGARGGRTLVVRHLPHGRTRLARAERWFARWGLFGVLLGRLTPLARSFISIPAGGLGMRFWPYSALTLAGSAIWAFAFAGGGWALGAHYGRVDHAFRYAEYAVLVCALGALVPLLGRLLHVDARDDEPTP